MEDSSLRDNVMSEGRLKWFNPAKGFGFILCDDECGDVLLHANVLSEFGVGSIAEGSLVEFSVKSTERGRQATEILSITPPATQDGALPPVDHSADLATLEPLMPARVKWFDVTKGFGFATVFGREGGVFLHGNTLRRSGISELATGEAIAVRVMRGERGWLAAEVGPWDSKTDDKLE